MTPLNPSFRAGIKGDDFVRHKARWNGKRFVQGDRFFPSI
jgi:hypothetical protein